MNKLCILDKDGTIVKPASGETFVQHPQDQVLLPGVERTIAQMASEGYTFAIASNQGGVEAGHKTLNDAFAEMRYCLELLPQIDCAYFCPTPPKSSGDHCWQVFRGFERSLSWNILNFGFNTGFRKPNPGMLQLAVCFGKADEVLYVGDRDEDKLASEAANIPFQWAHEWRES